MGASGVTWSFELSKGPWGHYRIAIQRRSFKSCTSPSEEESSSISEAMGVTNKRIEKVRRSCALALLP
jgi:hypothetical protein